VIRTELIVSSDLPPEMTAHEVPKEKPVTKEMSVSMGDKVR